MRRVRYRISGVSIVKLVIYLIFSAVIFAVPTYAGPANWAISKSYNYVRSELIRRGFRPTALKHDKNIDIFCYEGFCARYPEVLNCTGTGLNPCMFVYELSSGGKYLIVDTHGETRLTVTGVHWARQYELQDILRRK